MTDVAASAIATIRRRSRAGVIAASGVDVHFQPDAPTADGRPVLAAIVADMGWRTQFETGTSNGGLTARRGGDRFRWESRLFGGAYDDAPLGVRPVYGGLRTGDDPYGTATRFGSSALRLRNEGRLDPQTAKRVWHLLARFGRLGGGRAWNDCMASGRL